MKYPPVIFILIIISLSCNDQKPKQDNIKIEIKTKKDSIKSEVKVVSAHRSEVDYNTLVMADVLTKFNYTKGYFIPLNFEIGLSDSIFHSIENSLKDNIFQNDEVSRMKLPDQIAENYFITGALDRLIIIDDDQEVIDTLERKNYEFFDALIEYYYIATYETSIDLGDSLIAISANVNSSKLKKSIQPTTNLDHNKKILENNNLSYDKIFSQTTIVNNSDTLSILSFGNYTTSKNSLHLYRNGRLKDSIINEYMAVSSIKPIPLATENELTYIYYGFKPDTDWFWNGLLGIDLIHWKLKLYEKNRIEP